MSQIGTPLSPSATRVLLLGSGELGKELAIELQRFGVEVIAVDRYANAPAMQVAQQQIVMDMTDAEALKKLILEWQPHHIVPEIEAIATPVLQELEQQGFAVTPNARAVRLTMDRAGIRQLAAETLSLPTSKFYFVNSFEQFNDAIAKIGLPCVIKPIMSSSGKGQSIVKKQEDVQQAWQVAHEAGRTQNDTIMVESFIPFDYEITLLTVRHCQGTSFCEPIGHIQESGDYQISWQPHPMSENILKKAQSIAQSITDALGGFGVFGVELFVKGEEVFFNEVSPRPHDTGLVTLLSQNLSEFALHARAILGLPIPNIRQLGITASKALLVEGESKTVSFADVEQALIEADTDLRLFGKPEVKGKRRMGVFLAQADTVDAAIEQVKKMAQAIKVSL